MTPRSSTRSWTARRGPGDIDSRRDRIPKGVCQSVTTGASQQSCAERVETMCMFLVASDHQGVWAVEAIRIRRALRRAELSDKEAAAIMGIDKGRFSKMLAGVEHFSW